MPKKPTATILPFPAPAQPTTCPRCNDTGVVVGDWRHDGTRVRIACGCSAGTTWLRARQPWMQREREEEER